MGAAATIASVTGGDSTRSSLAKVTTRRGLRLGIGVARRRPRSPACWPDVHAHEDPHGKCVHHPIHSSRARAAARRRWCRNERRRGSPTGQQSTPLATVTVEACRNDEATRGTTASCRNRAPAVRGAQHDELHVIHEHLPDRPDHGLVSTCRSCTRKSDEAERRHRRRPPRRADDGLRHRPAVNAARG